MVPRIPTLHTFAAVEPYSPNRMCVVGLCMVRHATPSHWSSTPFWPDAKRLEELLPQTAQSSGSPGSNIVVQATPSNCSATPSPTAYTWVASSPQTSSRMRDVGLGILVHS